jgi:ABC-type ATPase involved in cell division
VVPAAQHQRLTNAARRDAAWRCPRQRWAPREGEGHPVALLSGGGSNGCIARAIVHRPAILLGGRADGNLDAAYASELGDLFKSFIRVGVTVVIATHDQPFRRPSDPRVIALNMRNLSRGLRCDGESRSA